MSLRELDIQLGWQIKKDPLEQANDAADELINKSQEIEVGFQSASDTAEVAFENIGSGANSSQDSIKELGYQSNETGREMTSSFDEAGVSLDQLGEIGGKAMGVIKAGMAAVIATGFLGHIYKAAANIQTLEIQLRNAAETEEQWSMLNDEFSRLENLSRGMFRGGDIMAIAQQVEKAGMGFDAFGQFAEHAMVVAVAKGNDFGSVMTRINDVVETGVFTARNFNREVGFNLDEALKKSGITTQQWQRDMDAASRQQFIYGLLIQESEKNIGTFNEITESATGTTVAFRGAIGDLGETMGAPVLGPLTSIIRGFTTLFDKVRDNPAGEEILTLLGWATALGTLAIGFAGITKAGILLKGMLLPLMIPLLKIGAIITATVLIVEDIITAFGGFGDSVTENLFNSAMEFLGFSYTFQEFREDIIGGLKAIGDFFDGIFDDPVAWGKTKIDELKGFTLQKIDDIVLGFRNLPDQAISALGDLKGKLKNKFTDSLQGIRNMLPFSPAKEGPLVDLHESGMNIIGNIAEGIEWARPLNISPKLEPVIDDMDYGSEGSQYGGVSGSSTTVVNHITIESRGNMVEAEGLKAFIDRRIKEIMPDWVEEYWDTQGSKIAAVTER